MSASSNSKEQLLSCLKNMSLTCDNFPTVFIWAGDWVWAWAWIWGTCTWAACCCCCLRSWKWAGVIVLPESWTVGVAVYRAKGKEKGQPFDETHQLHLKSSRTFAKHNLLLPNQVKSGFGVELKEMRYALEAQMDHESRDDWWSLSEQDK